MHLFSNQIKVLTSLALAIALAVPTIAHEVKVSGDVAATFHINPSHQPKVGKPSQAWFALTKKGGKVVALSQCDCKLAIYPVPQAQGQTQPLMQPILSAVNVDRYRNVPGATVIFPKSGVYKLELTGTPKAGAKFKPFQFAYEVTVSD